MILPVEQKNLKKDAIDQKPCLLKHSRLVIECAKLDLKIEIALAEEGLIEDFKTWPHE